MSLSRGAGLGTVYGYSAYGETQALGVDGDIPNNANQYTGRENDGLVGGTGGALYYYRARYYDPVLKRFVSEDPTGIADGLNVYAYVGGDPVNQFDPSGLWSTEAHHYFIDTVFSHLPPHILAQMKIGSNQADAFMYQTPFTPQVHGMSSAFVSADMSKLSFCDFIEKNMRMYNQLKTSPFPSVRRMAYRHLGFAMHATMDSTSPAHANFQKWSLSLAEIGRHGDFARSLEDINAAPRYLGITWARMMEVFDSGTLCHCRK